MRLRYYVTVAAGFLACAAAAGAETLNNQTIVALSKAGLGADTLVAKIKSSATAFDLSTDALIALKQQNVPDSVIATMITASTQASVSTNAIGNSDSADPRAPHASGIYLLSSWSNPAKMVRMDATAANQMKTGSMLGYAFSYGIAPIKMKAVLSNPTARVKVSGVRPEFYFYFDQATSSLSNGGSFWSAFGGGVTSPNEFSLVRFETKKGSREAVLGKISIGGVKNGVMDKARVAFTYSDVSPGVFKVSPDADLTPGEYGFVYSSSAGASPYGGGSSRIFDFSVGQ